MKNSELSFLPKTNISYAEALFIINALAKLYSRTEKDPEVVQKKVEDDFNSKYKSNLMGGVSYLLKSILVEISLISGRHFILFDSFFDKNSDKKPGEIIVAPGDVEIYQNNSRWTVNLSNHGALECCIGGYVRLSEIQPYIIIEGLDPSLNKDALHLLIPSSEFIILSPGQTSNGVQVAYFNGARQP